MPAPTDFPTQRSVPQVLRRHAPGSLVYIDEHSMSARVTRVEGERDLTVDQRRLHAQVLGFLWRWRDRGGEIANISEDVELRELVALTPTRVRWEPFPHIYRCVDDECQVLHDPNDRTFMFTGRCRRCGKRLRQLQYVYFHPCGTLSYLKPPSEVFCPVHRKEFLYFNDTRKFQTSSWRCRECDFQASFYFPTCTKPQCRANPLIRPRLQGSFWNDQWVHYCQTLDYINLNEETAAKFIGTPRARSVLHKGVLGDVESGGRRLQRVLDDEGALCPQCGARIPNGSRYCGQCGKQVTDELFLSAAGDTSANFSIGPDSGRVAWAILRDLESSRSLRYEAARKESENVPLATDPFRWGLQQAARVGVHDLVLVDSFPLTTATLGFTRHTSGPPAWLTGFQTIEDRGKQLHPIYTHTVETEAWMVQLGAVAVALWLIENGVEPFAAELAGIIAAHQRDERTLKEWFIERLARIDSDLCTPEDLKLHAVVFSLLHTYSHVLLLSLATQSGLEAGSLGEVILADALGFVVYAGDTDLGAFSAAFTQMAGVVFSEVADAYASCKLDPSCSQDDGGACVGCIQLQHGCQTWNEHLSRSYLFGGPTKSEVMPDVAVGFLAMASTV